MISAIYLSSKDDDIAGRRHREEEVGHVHQPGVGQGQGAGGQGLGIYTDIFHHSN